MAKRRQNGTAVSLSPESSPADPSPMRIWALPPSRTGGVRVTEDTALTFAAVYACRRVISETVAGLPWRAMRQRPDGGSDVVPSHPADWLLNMQANPEMSAFTFRECIVDHALAWGNGYAEIERNGS